MTVSLDTNLLLPALEISNPLHGQAAIFVESLQAREDVVVSEFMLAELYGLVRNPTVVLRPRSPSEAVSICQALRNHPRWRLVGVPTDSRLFHDILW